MDNMLQQILVNTYNPNPSLRQEAESALSAYLHNHGAFYSLLGFVQDQNVPRELRQSASIVMKNKAGEFWRPDEPNLPISLEEKENSKALLVDILLVETDNSVRGMLAETIRNIAMYDFPQSWPSLVPTLLANIQTSDVLKMYNALLAMRKLVKRYEYKHKEEREPLHDIVRASFPYLQQLMTQILENNSIEAAQVQRMCLKIFYSATQYALPQVQGVDVNLWFHVLATLLSKPLPEASEGLEPAGQPESIEDRNAWPWWKMKKWVSRIITRFIQRYGNPRYCGDENKAFAEYFRDNTAKLLLEPVVNTLIAKSRGVFVTDIVHLNCITYVLNSVEMSPTYKILKPHMDFLLFGVIYPTLSLSEADMTLFEDDPAEYIRKVHNPLEDWLDPRNAAINLLQTLARYRLKDTLPKLMPHLQRILEDYAQAPPHMKDHKSKEAAIVAIAGVSKILQEKKPYRNQIEAIIVNFIIPEFQSPVGFLRARACWVVEYFSEMEWKKQSTTQSILQGLLSGLRDPALPVQAAAACSLRLMIHADGAKELIRPVLFDVVNEYFRIMSEIESDVVIGALQAIVLQFGDEVREIAGLITSQLLEAYAQYSTAGEDDDEAAFGACQCLDTITAVLEVVKEDPVSVAGMEQLLSPLVYKIFASGDDGIEYVDSAIEILSYVTYYPESISPRLWEIFGPMVNALDQWAIDYMREMSGPIMNLIAKDTGSFLQGSFNGEPYIAMLLRICEKVLKEDKSEIELEAKTAATLLTCVVSCCKGYIDDLIGPIMMLVMGRLPHCTKNGLTCRLLGVVLAVIVYNPEGACAMFKTDSSTEASIFQLLFDNIPVMHASSMQRLIIAAFSSLLALPRDVLPPFVQMNLQPIMSMLVRVLSTLDEDGSDSENGEDDSDEEYDDEADSAPGGGTSKSTLKKAGKVVIPEEGYDEDEDCVNVEDEEYLEVMAELAGHSKYNEFGDDDMDEDDEVVTPLDSMDMVLMFCDTMNNAHNRDPDLFNQLQRNLDESDQGRLQSILQSAAERRTGSNP